MRKFLSDSADALKTPLSDAQIDSFMKYNELMLSWNEKINLTSITEPNDVVTKHYIDSLSGAGFIKKDASVVDVGSGVGFPGIALKIYRDDLNILLLDSLNKRINFLNDVIDSLGLKNINAVHLRAEEGMKNYREKFDVATARAVASLNVLCEYCLPYVKMGGIFLAYKGSDNADEINSAKNAIGLLGGKIESVNNVTLPFSDITHSLIVIKKIKSTPEKYPRNSGRISKQPL